MPVPSYWADNYVEKKRSGENAISLIKPGQRVFIGSSCGEPQYLVRKLAEASDTFTDIEIVRLLSLESTPRIKQKTRALISAHFIWDPPRQKALQKTSGSSLP